MALRTPIRTIGAIAAGGLLAVGILHAVWLFSPWPLANWTSWSHAFGNTGFRVPDHIMAAVAILFALAAYIVAAQAGLLRRLGPAWIYRAGAWVIAVLFVLRAVLGEIEMARMLDDPRMTPAFRETTRYYLLIYLPLFMVLGVLSLVVALSRAKGRSSA